MRLERTGALLGHAGLEAVEVDAAPPFARDLAGEVDREPERVVEEERVLAVDVAATDELVEEIEATFERLAEALLLARDGARDRLVLAASSGYAAPITETVASTSAGVTGSVAPSRNAWRTARRMMRRST